MGAPVVAHAAPAYHAPAETYADEVSPYTYTYAVADDYSKAAFNAEETSDGASNVQGSYRVALPDGRIQTVAYTSNGYDGYVADVTYEGTAAYPEAPAPAYKAAPVVAHAAPAYHAPVVAHAAPVVAHAVHAPVAHTPVSAAVAPVNYGANKPVNGYGHGQVSHKSVSKPYQGEHRSTTQSKAFGSHAAVVADAPNRLHGADAVVSHGVHAVHAPVHHAVHAPVFGHGVHAPVVAHAPVHHAVHAAPAYHAPVHAGYVADDLAEPSPYSYTYAVADDYSGAAFQQAENNDGTGVVDGEYSVNLPDGRIQHVKYHANDYDGYVADVTYEGTASYANTVAHPVAHAVAHPAVVAHAVHAAPVVAHAGHGLVHGGLAHHGL